MRRFGKLVAIAMTDRFEFLFEEAEKLGGGDVGFLVGVVVEVDFVEELEGEEGVGQDVVDGVFAVIPVLIF